MNLTDFIPAADLFLDRVVPVPLQRVRDAMAAEGNGTRYQAWAKHVDTDSRDKHAAMGFAAGWGAALDQLAELWRSPE